MRRQTTTQIPTRTVRLLILKGRRILDVVRLEIPFDQDYSLDPKSERDWWLWMRQHTEPQYKRSQIHVSLSPDQYA
jgi:hypothetical protein